MPIDNKVAAGGVASAVTVVLVWIIKTVTDVDVPAEVAAAITGILSFAAGWIVRRSPTPPSP